MLWTGKRPTDTAFTAFYTSSIDDGATWSALQLLDTGSAWDPQIAVDDTHHVVHLVYRSNSTGIVHRTVVGGVVSAPVTVDASVGDISVTFPRLAVDTASGRLHALWIRSDWSSGNPVSESMVASWNGVNWSTPFSPLGDGDDSWYTIAAGPDGSVMIGTDRNGIARIAYSADGAIYGPEEFLWTTYPGLEEDTHVVIAWAPLDGTYHAVTTHDLAPGSSELYHYVRDPVTGGWSGPRNLTVGSTDGWSVRAGSGVGVGGSVPPCFVDGG